MCPPAVRRMEVCIQVLEIGQRTADSRQQTADRTEDRTEDWTEDQTADSRQQTADSYQKSQDNTYICPPSGLESGKTATPLLSCSAAAVVAAVVVASVAVAVAVVAVAVAVVAVAAEAAAKTGGLRASKTFWQGRRSSKMSLVEKVSSSLY